MSAIKQIVIFQLKALRMAGFLEFVQQVLNIVRTYRDSGEAGVSQLPAKVEAAYTPFVAGVAKVDEAYKISHSSEYTQQIADEDTRRDILYTCRCTPSSPSTWRRRVRPRTSGTSSRSTTWT